MSGADLRTHSALHVLKGAVQRVLGTEWTASVFVSGERGRLTVQAERKPTGEELRRIEEEANAKARERQTSHELPFSRAVCRPISVGWPPRRRGPVSLCGIAKHTPQLTHNRINALQTTSARRTPRIVIHLTRGSTDRSRPGSAMHPSRGRSGELGATNGCEAGRSILPRLPR